MNRYYNIISVVVIAALVALLLRTCNAKRGQQALYNETQDTLKLQRNKLGEQVASIDLLTATSVKQFTDLKTKDSLISQLQSLVKEQKGKLISATVLSSSTTVHTSGKTTITPRDTVWLGSEMKVYPEYRDSLKSKWYRASMVMRRDSSFLSFKVVNEFDLVQQYTRQSGLLGFMKPRIPITSVVNLNPYTETTSLRTFTIQCECHNSRWLALGAVGGASSVVLLRNLIK